MTERVSPDVDPAAASATRGRGAPLRWVPETRFGKWFLGTDVWGRYVVKVAIEEFVHLLPETARHPRRILDAGCGPGISLVLLDEYFKPEEIVGLDADPHEIARSTHQVARCRCQAEIRRGDVGALEFADGSFDMVLCHQTLHHVVKQEATLREFYRVLAPGGTLLLAESCREFILSAPVRLLFRHPNGVQKSASEYQELVGAAGFKFEAKHVATSTPFWSKLDWGLWERLTGRELRRSEPTELTMVAFKPTG